MATRPRVQAGNRRPAIIVPDVTLAMFNGMVTVTPRTASAIAVGDYCWLDTDVARPASEIPDAGSEAANQADFHDFFLGIALDASGVGESTPIRFWTRGRFRCAIASATPVIGGLYGPDENGAGNALENQKLVLVATASLAVGRCYQSATGAQTFVDVDIVSTVLYGGPMPL